MEEKKHVFVIAEAGSNWRMGTYDRDLQMAKTLIDEASSCGADAVKFQTYRAESVYASGAGKPDYLKNKENISIGELFADLEMPYAMIPELADYCKSKKIEFMSTPFSVEDARAIDPYVKIHKIASYEITHLRLIQYLAKTAKPLFLSTGAANTDDIEWAIKLFYDSGGNNISILQTTAKYPAEFDSLNLNVIPRLKSKFNVEVGLSDHSRNPLVAPLCAVALGATIIEKHFTLSNELPGPDHYFALTPTELASMVKAVRNAEESLGTGEKAVQNSERELERFARRSIQTLRAINKGDNFEEGLNIGILRPGNRSQGIHPKFMPEIIGKRATRSIEPGEGVLAGDYA